eukprot:TRINITY_DN32266_c0_g1_i1.p1 TRINITY_DN32266_c0_g1~~TRINITY_DN32266_c0_g1_i1.p1  ORF type:complete len:1098 (+),score=130.59 TRINITY_DN32266_c0_g1_i1:50-3343(+)
MMLPKCLLVIIVFKVSGAYSTTKTCTPVLLQREALSSVAKKKRSWKEAAQAGCTEGRCIIPSGDIWILDQNVEIDSLTIFGTLEWDQEKEGLELRASYILVSDRGHLKLGTPENPMMKSARIFIKLGTQAHPQFGDRFLAGQGTGRIDIHGRRLAFTWTLLSQDADNTSNLRLKQDPRSMGWQLNDRIGITTTSRGTSSEHVIVAMSSHSITVEPQVEGSHWGGQRNIEGRYFEMAAEVVNLERSVVITGSDDISGQGFHTLMTGTGYMKVSYTRIEKCGQLNRMGRYCLHFHLMGRCPHCQFQGNAVLNAKQVGITIHGTHQALVDQNIIWDAKAVGIYVEDGDESNNTISRNVVICTGFGRCATHWVAGDQHFSAGIMLIGMTNDVVGNRVVGHLNGFWTPGLSRGFGLADRVRGKVCPQFTPFGIIRDNVYHDNERFGLYLDFQHPRNIQRDADGLVTDLSSCEEFTGDGQDNGLAVANEVRSDFNWHNDLVGQYSLGDVQFINLTSISNNINLYWKVSKNFADGRLWHVLDSTFAHASSSSFGSLQLFGPGGAFTFGLSNIVFLGRDSRSQAILTPGLHCGLDGAAGTCNVQYLVEALDFSKLSPTQPRLGTDQNANNDRSLPVFLAKDESLGGYCSIVQSALNGFLALSECQQLDSIWGGNIGCSIPVRRLNIWGPYSGKLKLAGPGYDVMPNWEPPSEGRNAGEMYYGARLTGYGGMVVAGAAYRLSGGWEHDMVVEFSDDRLASHMGFAESVVLRVGQSSCTLQASDDRSFLSPLGQSPVVIVEAHHMIRNGDIACSQTISPPPSPAPVDPSNPTAKPISTTSTPSASTTSEPSSWQHFTGLNCGPGFGAEIATGDLVSFSMTLLQCKEACEADCQGIIVAQNEDPGRCWLRRNISPSHCAKNTVFDLWLHTGLEHDGFEAVAGGASACRGANHLDNRRAYYSVLQASSLAICKGLCRSLSSCKGIEFAAATGRCEVWYRTEGIQSSTSLAGYACFRYNRAMDSSVDAVPTFNPVDGADFRACRGSKSTDNSPQYYHLSSAQSLEDCKILCIATRGCKGIEYSAGRRCEVWTRAIEASITLEEFTCLKLM